MAIRVVRLGSARAPKEGLRLGTVRRPPRGVPKKDYARLDYFDLWLPDLAPSALLVSYALAEPLTPRRWATFARRYRCEMGSSAARRLIDLLAALSSQADLSIGCYCADELRCHRSLLRELLLERGAIVI
jgi:uncharacterized protein YeaO (DUF488 family)